MTLYIAAGKQRKTGPTPDSSATVQEATAERTKQRTVILQSQGPFGFFPFSHFFFFLVSPSLSRAERKDLDGN